MRLRARLALTLVLVAVPLTAVLVVVRDRIARDEEVSGLVAFARGRMENGGREVCEGDPERYQEPPPAALPGRGRPPLGRPGPLGRFEPEDGPQLDDPRPGRGGPDGPRPGARPPRLLGDPEAARPGPRYELWAYHADFHSSNPRAPAFPAPLRAALAAGADVADADLVPGERAAARGVSGVEVGVRMRWNDGPCALVLARRIEPGGARTGLLERVALPAAFAAALVAAMLLAFGPVVRRVRTLTDGVRRSAASGYAERVDAAGADELSELATAFNTAGAEVRSQLERLAGRERALRAFVENTTHDVMLPLTVLQGHLAAIELRLAEAGADPARVREAKQEAQYLGTLLENLAAAARLESDDVPLERHRFALNDLVERVAARHATIARGAQVELVHALPGEAVEVEGDVTLVERALSNLVHNAVRYGRPGGHVAVVLDVDGPEFVLRVLDDGPGVSEAELARIAERSYRTEAARRRHASGTGLGLAIAKEICDRHGFRFELRRRPEGGLEAEVRGPR